MAVTTNTGFLQVIDIGLRGLLFTKFHDILELGTINHGVILGPREIAQREMAEKRGATEVEMINLWRTRVAPDWKRMRTGAARRGMMMQYSDANKTDLVNIKAVPVNLEYSAWFWTLEREKLNLIAERYLFWQQDDPNLNMNYRVKVDGEESDFPIELDLHFGELTDESTVSEKYDKGRIFILSVPITVDGWILIPSTTKTILNIYFTVYDKDDLSDTADYEEVIIEDSSQDVELEAVLRLLTRTYNST